MIYKNIKLFGVNVVFSISIFGRKCNESCNLNDENFTKKRIVEVFFPNKRTSFIVYMFFIGCIFSSLCVYVDKNSLNKVFLLNTFLLFSSVVGGFFGFVFGMPRNHGEMRVKESKKEKEYYENTNLQEISDWMTKIIVGVGLTQFRSISDELCLFNKKITSDFQFGSESFSETVFVYFSIIGFFGAYFWAKIDFNKIIRNKSYKYLDRKIDNVSSDLVEYAEDLAANSALIAEAKIAIDSDKVSRENKLKYIPELEKIINKNKTNRSAVIVRARFAEECENNINLAISILSDFIKRKIELNQNDYDVADALYNRSIYNLKNGSRELCFEDLKESVKIKPLNKKFAMNDDDFDKIKDDTKFKEIVS